MTGSRSPHRDNSPKRLNQEQLEQSAARLSHAKRPEVTLKPLVDAKKLSKQDEEKSVKRLYDEAVRLQKQRLELLSKRHEEESEKKSNVVVMTPSDEQEAISRLYERSLQQRQVSNDELVKKYALTVKTARLDKEQQQEVANRLCSGSVAKIKESKSKLFEKYILDVAPKSAKRTKEELNKAAARLHAGER
jgi:hypothetical protein